jgi:hypothetical protein
LVQQDRALLERTNSSLGADLVKYVTHKTT